MHLVLVDRGVDHVQDQVGEPRLLERRAERVDELVGKLADEPDGVGHQVVAPAGVHDAGGRVQGVEQAVPDADRRAGERVEQRRLAGVRVPGKGHLWQMRALALGAHHRTAGGDVLELSLQRRDPVAGQPAVGLDLRLARSSGSDTAVDAPRSESLQVRPQAPHPRQVVFELGELDLKLALGAVRVGGEDVEDDRRAVDHRHPERRLEIALLARRQLVVAGDEVGVGARQLGS